MTAGDSTIARIGASGWQSGIEVRQLRAFLAVVEHGSQSAAALALGVSQSTVSEALTALDRAVGAQTLMRKRGAHAARLTSAGEVLLPYARRLLREIDGLHVAIAEVARGANAHVDIVANESVSTYVLAPALATLRERWPNLQVSVTVGTCASVRAAIATGQGDVGLLLEAQVPHPSPEASVGVMTIVPDVRLVIFGSARQPLIRRGDAVRRDMIEPYSFLIADSAGDFQQFVQRYFAAEGLPGPRLASVGSIEAVKRGVELDPTALGLLPDYALADDLAQQRVRALTVQPPPPPMQLVALTSPRSGSPHSIIEALLEALRRR